MEQQQFNEGLLAFIQGSPTPFHAVVSMESALTAAGFKVLEETASWDLQPGACYLVKRNGSIIALRYGHQSVVEQGLHLAGGHTDSPCLKVKPIPEKNAQGYLQLGVEVYGGALLNPWFDRDLSLAGKVSYQDRAGQIHTALVDLRRPVAIIPSLAIHLDREANKNRSVDAQKHLPPIVLQPETGAGSKAGGKAGSAGQDQPGERSEKAGTASLEHYLLSHLRQQDEGADASKILSHELFLYDTQPPAIVGLEGQFIAAARLDNLLSCYLITRALLEADGAHTSVMVCNDHEEVGSGSASGAQGPFLKAVLQRLVSQESSQPDALERASRRSLFLSIDNAHGVHPNYAELHDPAHGPVLNGGPVIKINANQRYASNTESVASFRACCEQVGVSAQSFVMRSDLACGSTIGPLTATETGINTVDVGVPTFAMHSIRELAGVEDAHQLYRVVNAFFQRRVTTQR